MENKGIFKINIDFIIENYKEIGQLICHFATFKFYIFFINESEQLFSHKYN